ncbi:MAG TPA: DciA family protein [Elusimicrobiota bacterium]|nr:DciA family protein [Elusimicrobiota bacterium]
MGFTAVQQGIRKVCDNLGLSEHLLLIERAWDAEMGGWGGLARIVALDNGALIVETASASARQELSLRRPELVRRLNQHLRIPMIRTLTIRVAQR